jgi:hypothetical protein
MKIRSLRFNNKGKGFDASVSGKAYVFPYVKARPIPTSNDPVIRVYVDKELDGEGFTTNCNRERPEPSTQKRCWNTIEIPTTCEIPTT